jgi:laminin alpha 3/5
LSDKLICRCSHNTCGDQCETCCEGFVQKRWRQNRENQEFECERNGNFQTCFKLIIFLFKLYFNYIACQCYGHSSSCVYNATVDQNKESIDIHGNYEGGGVCQNCEVN